MNLRNYAPLCLAALASCAMPTIGVEPRIGMLEIDGDVSIAASGTTLNNSTDDLGMDDDDGAVSLRGDFQWGMPHLSVSLQQTTHDGSGTLSQNFGTPPNQIPAGTQVSTDFDLGLHTAYLTFDLIPGDWELGLGLGAVVVDTDLETSGGGATVTADETIPIPVVAARASVGVWRVDLEALVGVMSFSGSDADLDFLDLDVNGQLRLFGDGDRAVGLLTLGIRHTDIDAEWEDGSEDVSTDLTLTGPYLGFRLQF